MDQNKSIYFFITYFRKQKEKDEYAIDFVDPEDKEMQPKCIYVEKSDKDNIFFYNKIFKVNKSAGTGKKGNNFHFEFQINEEKYVISFDSKGCTFVYDVNLMSGKKIIDIRRKVEQNKENYQIFEYYIKALEKEEIKEEEKEILFSTFYNEAIKLYSSKKSFAFLIKLFLKIYLKKDLCTKLLGIFKKINEDPNEKSKNNPGPEFLKEYTGKFGNIKEEAEKIINDNGYDSIEFYGLILCYLNNYDFDNFSSIINELYAQNDEKKKILYDILLTYNGYFINNINKNFEFFNNFIEHSLDKKFSDFEKGLNYIDDIETYISIIDTKKKKFYEKFNSKKLEKIVKLDNLKLKESKIKEEEQTSSTVISETSSNKENDKKKNKNINDIICKIRSILTFCKTNKTFIVFFTNNFWEYILNYYNESKDDNIKICYDLRELFKEYHKLVVDIFKQKEETYTIKKEANIYFERDEFAIILNQIIKKFNNNQEEDNQIIDKLKIITQYNPYYREERYSNKVDCDIFDSFDLDKNKEYAEFREMNFESIFKDSITDYIKKFMEKIKNISHFEAVMKLINIDILDDKNFYLKQLKIKYDNIISNEIGLLPKEKLGEAIYIIAKLAIFNYIYETEGKKFEFINEKIVKLDDNNIRSKIYIEIINICFNKKEKDDKKEEDEEMKTNIFENKINDDDFFGKDFEKMKEFIYGEFSEKIESEEAINNIIDFINCLEIIDKKNKDEKMIEEFYQTLINKNLFNKEEFFSSNKSYKILLLSKLQEKKKIKKIIKDSYQKILDSIQIDIDRNIKKSKLEEFLKNGKDSVTKRLELIKITVQSYDPEEIYTQLKKINDNINEDINKLRERKENLFLYFKEGYYQNLNQRINDIIRTNQNQKITDYKKGGKIGELIKETENLEELTKKIKEVKPYLLFNVIYDMNLKKDEEKKFNESYDEFQKIGNLLRDKNKNNDSIITDLNDKYNKNYFKKIKEKLSNDDKEASKFITDLKNCYNLDNKDFIKKLDILFKSKKYELDINSIIYFFEYKFEKDDWNKKLPPKDFMNKWEESFQNIIDFLSAYMKKMKQ